MTHSPSLSKWGEEEEEEEEEREAHSVQQRGETRAPRARAKTRCGGEGRNACNTTTSCTSLQTMAMKM
jgi:hypothetical protein